MSDTEKASAIGMLLNCPGWNSWLQPLMVERMKQTMEGLAAGKSDKDDIMRGWFQALRWVINLPGQELENIKISERDKAAIDGTNAEDDFRARMGYRSPFIKTPEPGETKIDDADPTSAIGA